MDMELAAKKCVSCEGGMPPATRDEAEILLKQVNGWTLSGDARWISKEFKFKDFAEALAFTEKVGALAESEGHHPDIQLSWGKVVVELTTHAIKGLSENDFIIAAKIDQMHKV
jgi:4a-hydroxytetrahydrobiopterin dehydratase